jgi:hypothetical protein
VSVRDERVWKALIFASLYQDKEVKEKSKISEEITIESSLVEISGLYSCEGLRRLNESLFFNRQKAKISEKTNEKQNRNLLLVFFSQI